MAEESAAASQNPINWEIPAQLESETILAGKSTDDFFQSSRLSADGNILFCSTDRNLIAVYQLPVVTTQKHYYYSNTTQVDNMDLINCERDHISLNCTLDVGDSLYDFQSHFSLSDPMGIPIVVTATRDHPIHLLSPSDKRILGSYIPINHLDELDFTLSVAFNTNGDKIYSGSDRKIRAFDIATAGRSCFEFWTSETRKSFFGQKGLISSISFNPDYSGLYAAGSFSGDVSVYAENSGSQSFFDVVRLGYGVDSLKWSPCGRYLWISGRNNPEITCWDVRNSKRKVGSITRSISSNQRNRFDIDPWGQYLIAGNDKGKVLCFDTSTFKCVKEIDTGCCNTVNACHFHPYSALIIASQGERTFNMSSLSESDNDSESENERSPQKAEINNSDKDTDTTAMSSAAEPINNHVTNTEDSIASLLGKRKALLLAQENSQFNANGQAKNEIIIEREYSTISSESRAIVFSLKKTALQSTEQGASPELM